jgi:hypothetical protein
MEEGPCQHGLGAFNLNTFLETYVQTSLIKNVDLTFGIFLQTENDLNDNQWCQEGER